jgi:hypothetical protein
MNIHRRPTTGTLDLRWDHVDLQRGLLFLPDSKTGKKTIVLGVAALAVLEILPRVGKFAIAGNDNDKPCGPPTTVGASF